MIVGGTTEEESSQNRIEPGTDDLAVRISTAIADDRGVDPCDLPPIGRTIPIEEIETLVGENIPIEVTFEYHGYEVFVTGKGELSFTPTD